MGKGKVEKDDEERTCLDYGGDEVSFISPTATASEPIRRWWAEAFVAMEAGVRICEPVGRQVLRDCIFIVCVQEVRNITFIF